jgi:proteasome lid subunit RPN8/RPN11
MPSASPSVRIPWLVWWRLIRELKRRGHGRRESGAFLLGRNRAQKVTHFICYDDLDPTALDTGIIVFHGEGFVPLWEYCRTRGMRVLADVHTHASEWTGQSDSDRTHPMICQSGHIALIVPHLAQRRFQSLAGVGIHEYCGDHRWNAWGPKSGKVRLTLL